MSSSIFEAMPVPGSLVDSPPAETTTPPLRIALVTDAWHPQVNGVVRTCHELVRELTEQHHDVCVIEPSAFRTCRLPRYPEIRLALRPSRTVARLLREFQPDAVHIATEGPLGLAARRFCGRHDWPFTTSYHTQFPLYLKRYAHIPSRLTYRFIRYFHGRAQRILVPTAHVGKELAAHDLNNTVVWSRGVDTHLFCPDAGPDPYPDLPRPIFLYAGRVAVEKNIDAFLDLDLPGSKVVVGDGPARHRLQRNYHTVHWAGYQFGCNLARHYAAADVFVFPSRSDTFGIVMLEANACGLPIAAYPVTGPIDVVQPRVTGCLHDNLRQACLGALNLDRTTCRRHAESQSWSRCAQIVLDNLALIEENARAGAVI